MRAWWRAAVLAGVCAVSAARAQSPGYLELTVTALGAGAAALGASGESRMPVRPSDFTDHLGTLALHARGSRGSVRDVVLEVPATSAGERVQAGSGATLRFTFASGQVMSPRPGEGWINLTSWENGRAQGDYEATLVQGLMTLNLSGHFDSTEATEPR